MTTPPTRVQRTIAVAAAAAFGGKKRVQKCWDDDHRTNVDVLSCQDSPWPGVTSYATIGASAAPLVQDGKDAGVRTEFVGACYPSVDYFANCLGTAAFCLLNSGWFVAPGVVFPDVLAMYSDQTTMKHFLFLPPSLWDGLRTLTIDDGKVAWLMAIPISSAEREYVEREGVVALEELLDGAQIDVFDLNRVSVV
jgi:antitoxin YqcF